MDVIDKVTTLLSAQDTILESATERVWKQARHRKAGELARQYVLGAQDAISCVSEIVKSASVDIKDMMAEDLDIDAIEQMDRLSMLTETRRNACDAT